MSVENEGQEPPLPVIKGDWIESRGEGQPRVGRVVHSHWDIVDGERRCMVDVAIYDYSGTRVGRESPAMGGPRAYEPWLNYSEWFRIKKPDFPIAIQWVPRADGSTVGRYVTKAALMPDRTEVPVGRKQVVKGRALPKPSGTDYDPELEIRSRRMAAQELRDVNRQSPVPALIGEAKKLEAEAAAIAREYGVEK